MEIKNDNYRLSVAFCVVDETYALENAYMALWQTGQVDEFIFMLSRSSSKKSLATVIRLCEEKKGVWFYQSGTGLGNAIRDVFDRANGTHLLIWPADNGINTTTFPTMVAFSRANPDSIITVSRWIQKDGFLNYGKLRKVFNCVAQKALSLLFLSKLTDYTNTLQIAPVSLYRSIRWEGKGVDFIPEMVFKPLRLGINFIEIPCQDIGRQEGRSHTSFLQLFKYIPVIWRIRWMKRAAIRKEINA